MARDLRIMEWNANGLSQHQQELQAVLDTEKIDVCLISETHFTKQSFIKFRGYRVYHTIHPDNTARGGSAIIIKEHYLHYEEEKYETEEIQATAVSLKTKQCSLTLISVYCPPRHLLKKKHYLDFFKKQGKRFIAGGDFNAKNMYWGSRLTSSKGKELLEAANEYGCEFMSTGKPTYWPTDINKIPDLIDFFILKNVPTNYLQIEEGFDLNSDHSPILLTMSENIIKKENNPSLTNKFTDWESFKLSLEKKIKLSVPIRDEKQLDDEVELFVRNIQQAAWENTPDIKRNTAGNNYPKEVRNLLSEKRKLRKKWQQTRFPQDKTRLNNICQKLRREIQKVKNDSLNSYLKNLTADGSTDYSLWKATKKFKRPTVQSPPIQNEDGGWARNNKQKAERYAQYLETVFQPHNEQDNELPSDAIEQDEENIDKVTVQEICYEIKENINPKKAPGYDLITGVVLKQLPRKALVMLTILMNAAFRLKYVPSTWKVAEVIMIPKPGKPPHKVASYRPISLLPIISKLFEKLLLKRMKPIIERNNVIPNHQFGFRNKHATIDQVHRITNIIEKALEEKNICSAIFLDVAQAFDRVWHKGLIHKLEKILPKQFTQILSSYIKNRYFRVKQEDSYSELKKINAGVPQGSVLGPLLYLLYTSDIPQPMEITTATFADDTAILAVGRNNVETAERLQKSMIDIEKWTKKWKIQINETKSVHVNFTNKKIQYIPVSINNMQIPYSNSAKYLGMTLDAKLRWKVHVKKKREELGHKYRKMYWLIGKNSNLSLHNKLLLYKQILKPTWTYGIQLWGCTKISNINVLQRFQNKVLRNMVQAPWYIRNSDLHRDLMVDTVVNEVKKIAKSHEERLHRHVNIEAIQILDTTDLVRRLKRTKPHELF